MLKSSSPAASPSCFSFRQEPKSSLAPRWARGPFGGHNGFLPTYLGGNKNHSESTVYLALSPSLSLSLTFPSNYQRVLAELSSQFREG